MEDAVQRDEVNDPLSLAKALSDLILDWDVTEDDGSPFSPTPENLALLAYPVLNTLMERLILEYQPTRAEGEGSRNSSSTPSTVSDPSAENHQNGQEPSSLQLPSTSPSTT